MAHLTPVLDDHGEPYRSSGAFAVVFKMQDKSSGKYYALKCFTEEQQGRAEAYRQIADELDKVEQELKRIAEDDAPKQQLGWHR